MVRQKRVSKAALLDEINEEMRGRPTGLEADVDALLDRDYQSAQLHLEVARLPEQRAHELQAANPSCSVHGAQRTRQCTKYLVAQHLVIVYSLLNDTEMVRQWLRTSC